ncbi:MAG: KilA-N domain-containing protein [Pedobacter sp.]|nr:MAG: KilA-N domain-containing protein [Pedobacter sp.]
MQQIFEFQFNGKVVEFNVGETDVMVNATEMAKLYGQKPYAYLRKQETKKLIKELQKTPLRAYNSCVGAAQLNALSTLSSSGRNITSENSVTILRTIVGGKKKGSTWMHHYLALDFAGWLDAKFKLWMIVTVDKLLHEYGKRTKKHYFSESKTAQQKRGIN